MFISTSAMFPKSFSPGTALTCDRSQDWPRSFTFRLAPTIVSDLPNRRDADEIRSATVAVDTDQCCQLNQSINQSTTRSKFAPKIHFSKRMLATSESYAPMTSDVDWPSQTSYSAAHNAHKLGPCAHRTPFCGGIVSSWPIN